MNVYFDNWFSTLNLFLYLKQIGINAVGTIRQNRLQGCPLKSSKEFCKEERGSYDYHVDSNSGIVVLKWLDNNIVHLASNYAGVEPVNTIQRWCSKSKTRKLIPCPKIVTAYNKCMGGVDLADMLIALYRIKVKTKRWYIKVFLHFVDIAKVNAWILYRRHCNLHNVPAKSGNASRNLSQRWRATL